MGKRQRMVTDEVLCSTKFLNMHNDTQLLYVFLLLYCDDDGIVDPFPVMRLTGITNLSALEELVDKEFIYQVDNEGVIFYVIHFHVQNRIPPSKKVDSIHLPKLIEKHPELIGTIVVGKKYADSFSLKLEEIRKMETDSKILPNELPKIRKENNKENNNGEKQDENREYIGTPMEIKQKMAEWKRKL